MPAPAPAAYSGAPGPIGYESQVPSTFGNPVPPNQSSSATGPTPAESKSGGASAEEGDPTSQPELNGAEGTTRREAQKPEAEKSNAEQPETDDTTRSIFDRSLYRDEDKRT